MQNSRLFSRLFSKTITSFSTLKVIRKVIILKDAGTSSWRARLNKIWPKPEKKFTHIALIVALKKIFISFSRLLPGLETCAGQISRLFQEFYVRILYPSVVMTEYGDSLRHLEFDIAQERMIYSLLYCIIAKLAIWSEFVSVCYILPNSLFLILMLGMREICYL